MTRDTVQRVAIAALITALATTHQPDPTFGRPAVRAATFVALTLAALTITWVRTQSRSGRSASTFSLWSWPTAPLFAALLWIVLVSPLGVAGAPGVITAVALASSLAIAAHIADRFGFVGFERVLGPVLLLLLSHATVVELTLANRDRWVAWAEEPNVLGVLGALGLVAGARALRDGVVPLLPLLPISLLMLVQTEARLPLFAGAVGAVVMWQPRLRRGGASLVLVLGLLVGTSFIASGVLGDPVVDEASYEEAISLTGRTALWDLLVDELGSRPLIGYGPDSTHQVANSGEVTWNPHHAHNIVLQAAMHGGWPAGALVVATAIAAVVLRRRDPDPERDAYLLCLALIGMTEHIMREPSIPFLVLCVGVASIRPARARRSADQSSSGSSSISSSSFSTSRQPSISASAS